jgi:hypothetical protein
MVTAIVLYDSWANIHEVVILMYFNSSDNSDVTGLCFRLAYSMRKMMADKALVCKISHHALLLMLPFWNKVLQNV